MRLRTGLCHLFLDLNVGIGSKMGLNAGQQNYFLILCAPESDPIVFTVEPSMIYFFGDVDIGFADKLPTTRNKVGRKINPKMVSTRWRRREEPLSPNTKKARQKIVRMYADRVVEQQKESRVELYGKIQKMMHEAQKVYTLGVPRHKSKAEQSVQRV
jgi:hypothetical protein